MTEQQRNVRKIERLKSALDASLNLLSDIRLGIGLQSDDIDEVLNEGDAALNYAKRNS